MDKIEFIQKKQEKDNWTNNNPKIKNTILTPTKKTEESLCKK